MVRKIIDKSHKQNVKQIVHVKVNIEDKKTKLKRRKRKTRIGGSNGGTDNYAPYAQSFNPVYIQSGNAPYLSGLPEPNRLVQSIAEDIKPTIVEKQKEVIKHPLIEMAESQTPISKVGFMPKNRGFGGWTGDSDVDSDAPTIRIGNPNSTAYYATPTEQTFTTRSGRVISMEERNQMDLRNTKAKEKRNLEKKINGL